MDKIITYNLSDDVIEKLALLLRDNFLSKGNDLSRVACVFGGERPALFVRRKLSALLKKSFIPPLFFSIDSFIDYILGPDPLPVLEGLDAYYLIYALAKKYMPELITGRSRFCEFLPWAREIVSFIEQLDLENVDDKALAVVEKSAAIGYEIPESVNRLLERIIELRGAYHRYMHNRGLFSRGIKYLKASELVTSRDFSEFDTIIFCNFFYLHATEQAIIASLLDRDKALCIFQGSELDWPVLAKNAQTLGRPIRCTGDTTQKTTLSLYQGFDLHSQAALVRWLLKSEVSDLENTVIVVPRSENVVALLAQISSVLKQYNISLGYPFKRTFLYEVFVLLLKAQEGRKGITYYAKDYLNLLRHPLIRTLELGRSCAITASLISILEDLLCGNQESSVSGKIFVSLEQIAAENVLYDRLIDECARNGIDVTKRECRRILEQLHSLLFTAWEEVRSFTVFAQKLKELLAALIHKSNVLHSEFNARALWRLQEIIDGLLCLSFADEHFDSQEIWEIFDQMLQSEKVPFKGSPLRGTQILGLFETRSLAFKNVIIIDVNESVLPKLKIYEPLIPREVMLHLGLNRLEKEEEIQHYQFRRLIAGACRAHLIYAGDGSGGERSRFIEELIWEQQKKQQRLCGVDIPRVSFTATIASPAEMCIDKTTEIVEALREQTYSASRINTYMNCPLQFYFQYVLCLKEQEDLLEDPQAACIGSFIHAVLEEAFGRYKGVQPVIDAKFTKYFFTVMDRRFQKDIAPRMRSDAFLLKEIIRARLEKFLAAEKERPVTKIVSLEQQCLGHIAFNGQAIGFRYTIDRIDELSDGSLVILDYKTGGADIAPKRFSALSSMQMNRESIKETLKSFQLPIYYYFVAKDFPGRSLNAELYNIRTIERRAFIHESDSAFKEAIMDICLSALYTLIQEIFDINVPFVADKEERRCKFCAFTAMCT